MTTKPPITSLGFCIRITVASSPIIELLLSRLVGWRLSSSSCQALDPERVGGAGDAERHAHGDDDDVVRTRRAFIPDPFAGVLYDLRDPIRFPDRHRVDAPHQAKAARRLLMFSEYAANTGYG